MAVKCAWCQAPIPATARRDARTCSKSCRQTQFRARRLGRKPLAFCVFLFEALGMVPGDSLDDLFPGTGVVTRAWAAMQAGKASLLEDGDASEVSLLQAGDASEAYVSSGDPGDTSPEVLTDTSRAAADDGSPELG